MLAATRFPDDHRIEIHPVKPLERLNGEIKRRTDVVGFAGAPTTGSISDEAAITRLVGSLMLERCDEQAVGRREVSRQASPSSTILGPPSPRRLDRLTDTRTSPTTGVPTPTPPARPRLALSPAEGRERKEGPAGMARKGTSCKAPSFLALFL